MSNFNGAYCRDCDFVTDDRDKANEHAKNHNGNHSVVLRKVAPSQ